MKRTVILAALYVMFYAANATEAPTFSVAHGYKDSAFTLEITSATADAVIYYTTDCTTPTAENGILYTEPLTISGTSTLRAVAIDQHGTASVLTAATYIFTEDVLHQVRPKGYPSEWGPYASIDGTAKGDYDMDPELCDSERAAANITYGLKSLPVLSIITDPGYLFSHEMDDEKGGIYIYTGGDASSTGSGYGDDWLRAASIEFWESDLTRDEYYAPQNPDYGFQVNCAIKIHGNASRQAEKTPKHSFRMKMKGSYGPKKLNYRLFGEDGGKKFDQIVIRAGFGNTWLHWLTNQQRQAMYTRDAWAKRMMAHLGHLSSGTRYAHLYLNGMYWGIYNPTERIDSDFCELHLGGNADDYDVVRYDNNALNTVDGNLDDYLRLLDGVANAGDYAVYQQLRGYDVEGNVLAEGDVLFDEDNFIDYILINYYGGNSDWDHHNWVAVHRHGGKEGFRWLPWDSELVLQGINDNVTGVNNAQCPTYILHTLMEQCQAFRLKFVDRAYEALCESYGFLRSDSTQQVWETLTAEISDAMHAESARWGDYRRDVHPYLSRGDLYTVATHFDPQCEYMREQYFPKRTSIVLQQLKNAGLWSEVAEAPVLYIDNVAVGTRSAEYDASCQTLSLKGSSTVYYTTDGTDPVEYTASGSPKLSSSAIRASNVIDMQADCVIKARVRQGNKSWGPLLVRELTVNGGSGINSVTVDSPDADDTIYNMLGLPVKHPHRGVYIQNGKKIIIK